MRRLVRGLEGGVEPVERVPMAVRDLELGEHSVALSGPLGDGLQERGAAPGLGVQVAAGLAEHPFEEGHA